MINVPRESYVLCGAIQLYAARGRQITRNACALSLWKRIIDNGGIGLSSIRVGILMGSDSDLEVMKEAAKVLDEMGVGNEVRVISAHRTPRQAADYAEAAEGRGLSVVIAGAGGAAHLAGVIAAFTPLPVIAVPIKTLSLQGLDSLLAMVQMPPGVPVATVAIDGAKNAGILAAQIVAVGDPKVRMEVVAYKKSLEEAVLDKAGRLERDGWKNYRKS